ncbi:MAG: RsiV family protein [Treponema sp.]
MKKIYLVFFVAFCVFYSCSKSGNWEEFKVEYEEKTETFQKEGVDGKYRISYPYFKDYPEFNEIVKKRIEEEKEYINDARDLLEHDVSFGEIRTSGKYIGFMFNMTSYFLGDAHPSVQVFSVNYDSEAKEEVSLNDVFSPLSKDYLKIFSDFTCKELTSRVEREELTSSDEFIKEGTMPEEKNFACFNLKGSEVILVFNQYQVAPYSSGISEVSVPLNIFK